MGDNIVVGKNAKTYYNTGTHASPVWVEVKRIVDLGVDGLQATKIDVVSRASKWKKHAQGLLEAGLAFGYLHKKGADTVFDKLLDMFTNGTAVEFAILDGPVGTSGSQGLRAFVECFKLAYKQELEGAQLYDVELAPAVKEESGSEVDPDWFEVP